MRYLPQKKRFVNVALICVVEQMFLLFKDPLSGLGIIGEVQIHDAVLFGLKMKVSLPNHEFLIRSCSKQRFFP